LPPPPLYPLDLALKVLPQTETRTRTENAKKKCGDGCWERGKNGKPWQGKQLKVNKKWGGRTT